MSVPNKAHISANLKGPFKSASDDGEWAEGLLKARIYEQLLLDIILGELQPLGAIDEKALCVRYAAGLSGVREALGRLALEGLVLRRPRVGTVVAPLDIREIEHAFQVRHMLEGPMAGLAAQNASPDDIDTLTHAFDGAEAAISSGDFRALLGMDRVFHRAVAAATGNPTLGRYVLSLQNIATRFWIYDLKKQSRADQLLDVKLHRALATAIARKHKRAAELAATHLVGDPPSAYPR